MYKKNCAVWLIALLTPGPVLSWTLRLGVRSDDRRLIWKCSSTENPAHLNSWIPPDSRNTSSFVRNGFVLGRRTSLMYGITCRSSLDRINRIHDQIMRFTGAGTDHLLPVYLVAKKFDTESETEISTQRGFELTKDIKCSFLEVLRMRNVNVGEAFHGIVRELRERQDFVPNELKSSDILKDAAVLS